MGWWLYHPLLKSTVDLLLKVSYLSSKCDINLSNDEHQKLEDTFGYQNSPETSCKCFWGTYLFQRGFLCPAVMMVGVNSSKNNLKRGAIINHVCAYVYMKLYYICTNKPISLVKFPFPNIGLNGKPCCVGSLFCSFRKIWYHYTIHEPNQQTCSTTRHQKPWPTCEGCNSQPVSDATRWLSLLSSKKTPPFPKLQNPLKI